MKVLMLTYLSIVRKAYGGFNWILTYFVNYFEGLLLVLLQMNLSPLVIPVTLMCTLRRRCLIKTATKSMEVANGWKCNLGDFFAHINHFVLIVPNFIPKPLRLQGCVEKLFSPIVASPSWESGHARLYDMGQSRVLKCLDWRNCNQQCISIKSEAHRLGCAAWSRYSAIMDILDGFPGYGSTHCQIILDQVAKHHRQPCIW